jgi:hypothetical protein
VDFDRQSRPRAGIRIVDAKDAEVKREGAKEIDVDVLVVSVHHRAPHQFPFVDRIATLHLPLSFVCFSLRPLRPLRLCVEILTLPDGHAV